MIPHENKTTAIIQMCFEFFENIALNPVWWDTLDNYMKESLINRFYNHLRSTDQNKQNALLKSGFIYDDWEVTNAQFS